MKRNVTKDEAYEMIATAAKRAEKPILIGEWSLKLGWPLKWVEEIFEQLEANGVLRRIFGSEAASYDLMEGYVPRI